jgi:predicted  nucleic acid-binding Zn-ribbon protein
MLSPCVFSQKVLTAHLAFLYNIRQMMGRHGQNSGRGGVMTDSQKLDLILSEMQGMKGEMQSMKGEMQSMKGEMQKLNQRMTNLELHLENGTDKNIQLLAENFVELTKKLNQAIPAADKNLAYEVKVNYLIDRVHILEEDVKKLKLQFT